MADWSGRAIEYLDKNELRLGYVTKQHGQKLQVLSVHGRQEKCAEKQVVHAVGRVAHGDQLPDFAAEFQSSVDRELASVDLELIWEFAREDERDYDVSELAELLFGERGDQWPAQCSALFRTLLSDSCYFKRKSKSFAPRPEGQVRDRVTADRRRVEREAELKRVSEFLRRTLKRKAKSKAEVPEEMEPVVEEIYAYLYQRLSTPSVAVQLLEEWYDEKQRRPAAYRFLLKAGRIGSDVDPFLALAGISTEFTETSLGCALRLDPFRWESGSEDREDLRDPWTISVDDRETREVDDAFSLEPLPDGLRLGIHIADVAAFSEKGDGMDREAGYRALTVYLPRGSTTMFPERLSCDLASLLPQVERPAVSLILEIGDDLQLRSWRFARTVVRVDQKLSYGDVDRALAGDDRVIDAKWHDAIDLALRFARGREDERRGSGALVLERKDISLKVEGEQIRVDVLDPSTPSHVWVREMMILYNRTAAEFASAEGVSVIYRSQDAPETPLPPIPDRYDPVVAESIFRLMKPSRLTLVPLPHASLALDAYTQVTSPLRRYADLVLQRQLVAHLAGEPPPYESAELMEVSLRADTTGRERSALERQAKRFWTITYLERYRAEDRFAATLIKEDRGDWIIELDELLLRGALDQRPPGVRPGESLLVEIASIDAAQQHIRFRCVPVAPNPS